jgi:glutathione synthase/RimK-type ligase-like ATP-grasp enzyme
MILVISSKNVYAVKRLLQEAKSQKPEVSIMDVQDLVACNFKIDIKKFDVLYVRDPYLKGSPLYLPQIIRLAKKFKAAGKKVVDFTIANGELGRGKWADYQKLQKTGLPIPKTDLLFGYSLSATHYPLILKWTYGFKARNVFLVKNQDQLKKILPMHPKKEWLVQEYLRADYEYKVITVGYKALPMVLRFKIKDSGFRVDFTSHGVILNPNASAFRLRSRHPEHGRMGEGEESLYKDGEILRSAQDDAVGQVVKLAESASKLLGRELAKVDILETKGKFYILEVNRFPGLKSFEKLTSYNVFKDFFKYLK